MVAKRMHGQAYAELCKLRGAVCREQGRGCGDAGTHNPNEPHTTNRTEVAAQNNARGTRVQERTSTRVQASERETAHATTKSRGNWAYVL